MPVHLVRHPIAQDALLSLRDRTTTPSHFRRLAHRLSVLLVIEATRDLRTTPKRVDTPLEPVDGLELQGGIVVVPVLRAGLSMTQAVLDLLPHASVGHIGLQRDEATAAASQYYVHLPPDLTGSTVLMVDPMLATGGSAIAGLRLLEGAGATDIRILAIVAAPEGLAAVEAAYPQIPIFTPAVDRQLDSRKFILPGLGDFGDRLYGTS